MQLEERGKPIGITDANSIELAGNTFGRIEFAIGRRPLEIVCGGNFCILWNRRNVVENPNREIDKLYLRIKKQGIDFIPQCMLWDIDPDLFPNCPAIEAILGFKQTDCDFFRTVDDSPDMRTPAATFWKVACMQNQDFSVSAPLLFA